MRLKYVAFAVLLPLLLLAPHATFADTLTLTGVGGANTDGVYTYPYEFTVTNASGTSTDVLMSCLNFDREIYFGETWSVTEESVLSVPVGGTDNESQAAFLEDAYLFNQYAGASGNAQVTSDLQFAIWDIMDPSVATSGLSGYDTIAQSLVAAAEANYNTSAALAADANDVVYLPVAGSWPSNDGEPQIFMVDPPPAAAPEPSSLVLLGTGLLAAGGVMRRRLQTA